MDRAASFASLRGNRPDARTDEHMDVLTEHDEDFIGWTERQAEILRALPSSFRGLDTESLAEEIEDLGRAEIRAVESLLRQILIHMIKLASEPAARSASHWITEIVAFHASVVAAQSASIRRRLDLADIWDSARIAVEQDAKLRGTKPAAMPEQCPFTLDELLVRQFDLRAAVDSLRQHTVQ